VDEEVQKEKEGGAYVTQQSNYITRCQKHVAKQACWKERNLIFAIVMTNTLYGTLGIINNF